jgi:hypothetical protein
MRGGAARRRRSVSGEDRLVDVPFDVGEPHIAANIAKGQALVIEAEHVQYCGVQVVYVNRVLAGFVAQFVGRTLGESALHAAAGEPERKALVVVVAAVGVLAVRRAAELASPDQERIVEQPALAQIGQQPRDRPIDGARIPGAASVYFNDWR